MTRLVTALTGAAVAATILTAGCSKAKDPRLSRETVRKICVNEPGVLKVRLGRKKSHTTYSVPESVARRIHTRLVNGG